MSKQYFELKFNEYLIALKAELQGRLGQEFEVYLFNTGWAWAEVRRKGGSRMFRFDISERDNGVRFFFVQFPHNKSQIVINKIITMQNWDGIIEQVQMAANTVQKR